MLLRVELGGMAVIGEAAQTVLKQEGIELLPGYVDPRKSPSNTDE